MNSNLLHFLNLQYIFYLIYTLLFGWRNIGSGTGVGTITGSTTAATATSASSGGAVAAATGVSFLSAIGAILAGVWAGISFITYALSAFFIAVTVYSILGIMYIRAQEEDQYRTRIPVNAEPIEEDRFTQLLALAGSDNPKEWRAAIMGADELLRELLISLGYVADTVDEQLRAVPDGAFATRAAAWEAHRAKNIIEGGAEDFILTKAEAVRILHVYKEVFDEHGFA